MHMDGLIGLTNPTPMYVGIIIWFNSISNPNLTYYNLRPGFKSIIKR